MHFTGESSVPCPLKTIELCMTSLWVAAPPPPAPHEKAHSNKTHLPRPGGTNVGLTIRWYSPSVSDSCSKGKASQVFSY
jgi:hypothetical protein